MPLANMHDLPVASRNCMSLPFRIAQGAALVSSCDWSDVPCLYWRSGLSRHIHCGFGASFAGKELGPNRFPGNPKSLRLTSSLSCCTQATHSNHSNLPHIPKVTIFTDANQYRFSTFISANLHLRRGSESTVHVPNLVQA